MRLPGRTNGYLNILSQGSEKLHQALDGERSRAITHQRRDVRLLDAKYFAGLGLCNTESPYETVYLQRKLGFQQLLFRMWQAKVRENVSTASLYFLYAQRLRRLSEAIRLCRFSGHVNFAAGDAGVRPRLGAGE